MGASLIIIYKILASAIRDYNFMNDMKERATNYKARDPFYITTRDSLSNYLLNEKGMIPDSTRDVPVDLERGDRKMFRKGYNILPGMWGRDKWNYHFRERISMGLFGGFAIIAPMLLIVLHNDLVTTLLTVSISTILFALAISYSAQLKGKTVLASVAAYAAALMVFVRAKAT
jgi:hypothetical protein